MSLNVLKAFLNHNFFNKGISIFVKDLFTVLILISTFFGFGSTSSIALIPCSAVSITVLLSASFVSFLTLLLTIVKFFFPDIFGLSVSYWEKVFTNCGFNLKISNDSASI